MLKLLTFAYAGELSIITTSFLIKSYLLCMLIASCFRNLTVKRPLIFLIGTILGSAIGDFGWIVRLLNDMGILQLSYSTLILYTRISWAFMAVQYQSLSLFLESLIAKHFVFTLRHKICSALSGSISLFFLVHSFFSLGIIDQQERAAAFSKLVWSVDAPLELKVIWFVTYYALSLMFFSIGYTLFKSRRIYLPVIVRHQLAILLKYLIGAHQCVEILQLVSCIFATKSVYTYPIITISTLILAYAIYYSVNKVFGIRFLNVNTHVQSKPNINLIHNFKNVVEQLSHVTGFTEVSRITQLFFKESFDIPLHKSHLYVRLQESHIADFHERSQHMIAQVEAFLTNQTHAMREYLYKSKILMYDELEFSNFYHDTPNRRFVLNFLKNLDADIFLPIYNKKDIIAYIVIDKHPRKKELYGNIERDEMIVLANYLSNIIYLLQHRNLQSMLLQEKELKDDLYIAREEAKLYKESMRSFILSEPKRIGVIFYKNRRFYFGNQSAKELIGINLNMQNGHPLAKLCRQVVDQATEYKTIQTVITSDERGEDLVLSAVPNLEQNNTILLVHQPEINDILGKNLNLLQNPTDWDYLLYLQTTKAGKLISQFIPGSGEMLINFKIEILRAALSRKPVLLMLANDDLLSIVEVLHHTGSGDGLHILSLDAPCKDRSKAAELFGFAQQSDHTSPALFKKLSDQGTLFIKNIHFLDLETQEDLVEYIKYGYYRVFNSEQRIASNVRIICSTDQNLMSLVQAGSFSLALCTILNKMMVRMPSLNFLPKNELDSLADGLTEQAVKTADFKNLLELSDKEKLKLAYNRPTSLQHLRIQVEKLLVHKSKKNHIFQDTYFDPAYHITDPELTEAARLGKHALRDQRIMTLLWDKFQNQNKIASFLGVNRSSVNRRCKQFNLE